MEVAKCFTNIKGGVVFVEKHDDYMMYIFFDMCEPVGDVNELQNTQSVNKCTPSWHGLTVFPFANTKFAIKMNYMVGFLHKLLSPNLFFCFFEFGSL